MTEEDKTLLDVVSKALSWYPEGPAADDSAKAIVVALKAWDRMSDEAKQAAPENVRRFFTPER